MDSQQSDSDAKRVVCHPSSRLFGGIWADREGLPLQVTDLCPPGSVYIFDPSTLFDPVDPNPRAAGAIHNLDAKTGGQG